MIVAAGTLVGALLGLLHAVYVFRRVVSEPPGDARPNPLLGLYYAAWVLGLWLLFGAYVLVLWLAGLALYLPFKAFR